MTTHKGKITISRYQSSKGPDGISIEITDESSGIRFCSADMTVEAFGFAITGLSHQECGLDVRGLNLIGKLREYKTERVPKPHGYSKNEADSAKSLKPFEVDGWVGCVHDLWNHHRSAGEGFQNVGFIRYVDQNEQPCNK